MCTSGCLEFTRSNLNEADVQARRVLEVGARDYNGTVRSLIEPFRPASYVGVDMLSGPGVDVVCRAEELVARFGGASFDVVVATELLEHTQRWRDVVSNLKNVTAPGGILLLTTRSKGFPFHGCPQDFWRFEDEDFRLIFSDFDIEFLGRDGEATPGVLLRARRPASFREADLAGHQLYSIIRRRRVREIGPVAVGGMKAATSVWSAMKSVLPESVIDPVRRRVWRVTTRS